MTLFTKPSYYLYKLSRKERDIIIGYCPDFNDIKYLLKEPIPFIIADRVCIINKGFATDGVTSGCSLSNYLSCNSAIAHDYLYAIQCFGKDICDSILRPRWRRWAVKYFGHSAWRSSGARGALFVNWEGNHISLAVYDTVDYHLKSYWNLSIAESQWFIVFKGQY